MLEELLSNDSGCSLDKLFFIGAKIVEHAAIRNKDFPIPRQKHCSLGYQPFRYAAIDFILATILLRSESNREHSKMKNKSVKKSLEKSKNVLEEKRESN